MGWRFHSKANEFKKDLPKENLELCVARTSCLLQIFLATTAARAEHKNAAAEAEGASSPAQDVLRRAQARCHPRRMLLQDSSWAVPVAGFELWEGFSPSFPKKTGIPQSPSLPAVPARPSPRAAPSSSSTKAQAEPGWSSSHLSVLCFCQWHFCSAACRLNFTHVYTT